MAIATLVAIRTKVRRLTRSPSATQISDVDVDEYVNTFIAYDFPEQLRQFSLKTTVTFFCNPYQELYVTDTSLPVTDPLYDFKNRYISVHPPVYIGGFGAFYSQSREQFYAIYPFVNSISLIGQGDGVTVNFTGTLSATPIMQSNVLFSSVNTLNQGLAVIDTPVTPWNGTGLLVVASTGVVCGAINYVTGVYNITFPTAPASGQAINSQTVPYVPSIPQSLLYFDDQFIVRPIPDQPYRIQFEAYVRPTQLLAAASVPDIEQWWQYIAFGAAIKLLQDRLDFDTIAQLMPLFKEQEQLVIRRTIVQNTNKRVATIYSEQSNMGPGSFGWGGGLF